MRATLIADAGADAGLGHLSRTGAVAAALRSRGLGVRCLAWGAEEPIDRDGLSWEPLPQTASPPAEGVIVLDSYEAPAGVVSALASSARLVLMHDRDSPPDAAIVTSTVGGHAAAGSLRLFGLRYACLRPAFWGLPEREPAEDVRRVLVATGGGDPTAAAGDLAEAARAAAPGAEVAVVRGPHASGELPQWVVAVEHPPTLLGHLLRADLLITAGGQTLLEAAAVGTPAIVVVLAENQRSQAEAVASAGGAALAEPGSGVSEAVGELTADAASRAVLGRRGQELIDGFGALRVGFHVARLIETGGGV